MSETTESSTPIDSRDAVTLKPLMGLRPGVYLAILYSGVILLALFGLLVLPGILHSGSLVRFISEPALCAVRVDDIYQGVTPCEVFVPSGKHTVTFASQGFSPVSEKRTIGARLFASVLAPKRVTIAARLDTPDPVKGLLEAAHEYAAWSAAGEPNATWQIPMTLSDAAYRFGPASRNPGNLQGMAGVLEGAIRYTANATALRDLLRADQLTGNAGLAASPLTIVSTFRHYLDLLSASERSSLWLVTAMGSKTPEMLTTSDWYKNQAAAASTLATNSRTQKFSGATGRSITLKGIRFIEVAAGDLVPQGSIARHISVDRFWIADREIDGRTWDEFTRAVPEWSSANKAKLMEAGKVSEGYLLASDDPAYPRPLQSGVSWYSAVAFCNWLSGSKPGDMASFAVRLPTENEWERAASIPGLGLHSISDGLWEWCEDSYAPVDYFGEHAVLSISGHERCVRGGSWANSASPVSIGTRAGLPAENCSAFTGIRPVIAMPLPHPEQ